VTLVNKDQLDILASLRESVNEDKAEIEADLKKIKSQLKEANDKNKMQLEQINILLLEKVGLQGDGIDVREKMLARERYLRYVRNAQLGEDSDFDPQFSDLKRVIAGKDLPEDIKSQLVALHEEVGMLKEQYKESQDKLSKAKAVRENSVKGFASFADRMSSSSNHKTSYSKRSKPKRAEELTRYVDGGLIPAPAAV